MSSSDAPENDDEALEDGFDDPEMNEADEAEVLAAEDELARLKEQVMRFAAEAENTRRRAERETNDARAFAIQKFSRDLLGVADNLSRALQHAPKDAAEPAVKNLVVGLEMTEKELVSAFARNGLKQVNPGRGDKFDPHFHQAMMEQPAEDVRPGAVIQVMQTGYELMGRIIRPAMVVVADKTSGGSLAEDVSDEPPLPAGGYEAPPEDDTGGTFDTKA
jgi:molecular chaperone GrpE